MNCQVFITRHYEGTAEERRDFIGIKVIKVLVDGKEVFIKEDKSNVLPKTNGNGLQHQEK